jgi:hypothetical protein
MTDAQSDSDAMESQPAAETGNISERVRTLQEKASQLSKTLSSIGETLREASGETKSRG